MTSASKSNSALFITALLITVAPIAGAAETEQGPSGTATGTASQAEKQEQEVQPTDEFLLSQYENAAKVTGLGMCDQFRSTLIQSELEGFDEFLQLSPAADSRFRFYVLKKNKSKRRDNVYFIKDSSGAQTTVTKVAPTQWYKALRLLSPEFLNYVMFPSMGSDCELSPVEGREPIPGVGETGQAEVPSP